MGRREVVAAVLALLVLYVVGYGLLSIALDPGEDAARAQARAEEGVR